MTPKSKYILRRVVLWSILFVLASFLLLIFLSFLNTSKYYSSTIPPQKPATSQEPQVTYLDTPEYVRAVYVSQCGATSGKLRKYIENLIKDTELNSVIIDVKDYTGTVAFRNNSGGKGCKVHDMKLWVKKLHEQGVYTVARITVFQDPLYTSLYPKQAVQSKSTPGTPWKDYKGLSFIDVGAVDFWKYIANIAKDAHTLGFDELNFDYIRYPSDGNMKDVYYTYSGDSSGVVANKEEELEKFFRYLTSNLRRENLKHIPVLSADLFGMTTTNTDDLAIGQVQERAEPYFNYIAPMVYPSHYPNWFLGLDNPNDNVYRVVNFSMNKAVERMLATSTPNESLKYTDRIGTTTPALYGKPSSSKYKLRPWLQDFDYGGDYDAVKVRAQIQATYDAGLNSWMLWNPANRYTREALQDAD